MKILVDADELHKIFIQAVKLKEQLEDNDTVYYLTKSLGSMWFRGYRDYGENLENSINQQIANNSWFNSSTGLPSDITDEDRAWAEKAIEEHQTNSKLVDSRGAINIAENDEKLVESYDLYSPNYEIATALVKHKQIILELLDTLIHASDLKNPESLITIIENVFIKSKALRAKLAGEK